MGSHWMRPKCSSPPMPQALTEWKARILQKKPSSPRPERRKPRPQGRFPRRYVISRTADARSCMGFSGTGQRCHVIQRPAWTTWFDRRVVAQLGSALDWGAPLLQEKAGGVKEKRTGCSLYAFLSWSGRQDLNLRPLDPPVKCLSDSLGIAIAVRLFSMKAERLPKLRLVLPGYF